ncbi:MAG: septum formation initiator family protein [Rhizobiales bacterium]|nr:septum formation initiator family protein [Hyphomicrobiales bacterium]
MGERHQSWHFLVSLCCIGLIGYFAYHAVHGRHGFERRIQLQHEARRLERELDELEAVRRTLSRDVALLRPEGIDPDMLGEQARRILRLAPANGLVIRPAPGEGPLLPEATNTSN